MIRKGADPGHAATGEELLSSPPVTTRLNQDVDHVAVFIDGPPEILLLAVDSNEVPDISQLALAPLRFRA